ncbi:hypothetical protein OROGR_001335 [Orobanche gracilis]
MEPKLKMDLGSECSIREVVEDNGEISNDSVIQKLENISEHKVQNVGSCVAKNNDYNDVTEYAKYSNSLPVDSKPDMSPSPTGIGHGLRKWRRIIRVVKRGGDSKMEAGKMMTRQLANSDASSSKRMQYDKRREKSQGSVSSTNALVQSSDYLGLGLAPPLAAGADSENSEDRSGKSSTAATAPKIKYEIPIVSGFPHDKSMMRNLSGKKLTQQEKGQLETRNKGRGEWVKIEKECSHSSLESDSRSSNFLFMQGTYSANDGTQYERLTDYDRENNDEFAGGSEQEVTDGQRGVYGRHDEGEYEGLSPEGGVTDSSSEVKEERSENHGSSSDQDPLHESLSVLQSVQEAIEKEVSKFQETGKTISADSSVADLGTEVIDDEVVETGNIDLDTEVEDLLKQKIEAEVERMVISRKVQELRAAAAVDQITVLEEQKALASEQTHILNKLGVAERKAAALEKKAEMLEHIDDDIASADEVMKLQSKVCKYGSCFFVQLILLLVVLWVFIFHLSPNDVEIVPT